MLHTLIIQKQKNHKIVKIYLMNKNSDANNNDNNKNSSML